MVTLTIGERVLLHLSRYDMVDSEDVYNIPWDLTQDGIASSLRISRAHASIELKKLRMAGKIVERQTHIKGGRTKRKSYFLTPLGLNDSKRIKDYAEEEGIDIMPLLDMKRCDPNSLLESIDDESREVLWLACVLRCSVKRDSLPVTKQSVIPVDVYGNIVISDDVKRNVVSVMNDDDITRMHSEAADYWISTDMPDRVERLYHLVKAGRMRDACRLLIKDRNYIMDMMDEGLYDTISEIDDIPEKYARDVLPIKIASAIEFGDADAARTSAERLASVDEDSGLMYLADLVLHMGDPEEAMRILSDVSGSADAVALDTRKAMAMAGMGLLNEARDLLENTKAEMTRTGNLEHLNDVYITLSTISLRSGDPDGAIRYLNKAKSSAGSKDMKRIYLKMSEVYEAMGIAEDIRRGT